MKSRFAVGLVVAALVAWSAPASAQMVSPWIYLNRCSGGCTIAGSNVDNAKSLTSSLPCTNISCTTGQCLCPAGPSGSWMVGEFKDSSGNTGSAADAEWAQILACIQKVYSPYNVTVTDQIPPNGLAYTESIIAGLPSDIGYPNNSVGGIAPGVDCVPRDNVISFTFANLYGGAQASRVLTLCAVAAQETGHAFSLDHAFEYLDGRSACTDPMSYQPDCGPRFFRNSMFRCGEYQARDCHCATIQDAHQVLLSVFGAGTPTTAPPHVTVVTPTAGSAIATGTSVIATAGAERGIDHLDLYLNGYLWATAPGAAFGQNGQPDASYVLPIPTQVPDGVIDIAIKAYDDLPIETDAPVITVTKGSPCADASTCLAGQKCDAGKCYWDPPVGMLGDACTYPQYCTSGICQGLSNGKMLCTQGCVIGSTGTCPNTFECVDTGAATGVCLPAAAGGGCCSASGSPLSALASGAPVLAWLLMGRRSRRRHSRAARRP